jgi:hypothetical protein
MPSVRSAHQRSTAKSYDPRELNVHEDLGDARVPQLRQKAFEYLSAERDASTMNQNWKAPPQPRSTTIDVPGTVCESEIGSIQGVQARSIAPHGSQLDRRIQTPQPCRVWGRHLGGLGTSRMGAHDAAAHGKEQAVSHKLTCASAEGDSAAMHKPTLLRPCDAWSVAQGPAQPASV